MLELTRVKITYVANGKEANKLLEDFQRKHLEYYDFNASMSSAGATEGFFMTITYKEKIDE